ncbi:MAG: helix-turn-helix transcriptional regulator [Myxococcales bacterium]|nr:helix-turn-helix transcriptional regulator [Myxococcales bacterium]MCB9522389.1 helix-turn-helix transcriptional regulator [Myxococcales bacterium]
MLLDAPLESDRGVLAEELIRHVTAAVSVLESRAGDVPPRWRVRLTDRQIQAAVLAAQGLSNEEVAAQLGVAPRTVARLLQDTYRRLEVSGRAALSAEVALLRPPTPFVPARSDVE